MSESQPRSPWESNDPSETPDQHAQEQPTIPGNPTGGPAQPQVPGGYSAPGAYPPPGGYPPPPQGSYPPPAAYPPPQGSYGPGGYPGEMYQQPGAGNMAQQTSMPTVSLVLGIVGFFTCALTSIPAIIVGIIGRSKARKFGQRTGQATAGIVLGVVAIVGAIATAMIAVNFAREVGKVVTNLGPQLEAATAANAAAVKASALYAQNGTYKRLTLDQLLPSSEFPTAKLSLVVAEDGTSVCIQGDTADLKGHIFSTEGKVTTGTSETTTATVGWVQGACPASGKP